ncbi:MAG: rod-binding protein [Deltaproteobacteria bacterium]|nr:rod-binding protein [Deltaproteobacteria bacterium]
MNAALFDPLGQKPEAAMRPRTTARPVADEKEAAAWKVAEGFESLFLHSMLKQMRATTFETEDSIGSSHATRMYQSMFDERVAEVGGRAHQFGIARMLHDHLVRKPAISDFSAMEKTSKFRRYEELLDPTPRVGRITDMARD